MTLQQADLKSLLADDHALCLSMFMPTFQKGPQVQQNTIRFKNLVRGAKEALAASDENTDGVEEQLSQLEPLIDDDNFWQHQGAGLAILATADQVRMHRLPITVAEAVYVGPRLQILPLLPVLQGDGEFFIVAVSRNECRLFSATRDSVSQIDADLPESLAAAVGEKHIKGFGMHSFSVKPRSADSTVPHGHVEADDEAHLLQYFREIDEAVRDVIEQSDTPLVFVGDDSLFALYQKANEHSNLVEGQVRGNPDDLSPEQLHEQAWTVIEPIFHQRLQDALDRYGRGVGAGETLADISKLDAAAARGQVDILFIRRGALPATALGRDLDDEKLAAAEHLGEVASKVLANSGKVFLCDDKQLNTESPAVALLRFAQL